MVDDIRRRGRRVIANIVDRTGTGPGDRRDQHARQIIDMDAREELARLGDALRGPGAQRVERAAARPVDTGEAENLDRHAAFAPQIEPGGFSRHRRSPRAPLGVSLMFRRPNRRRGRHRPSGRQIAEPGDAAHRGNIVAMPVEHHVAGLVWRNRDEDMGHTANTSGASG